LNWLRYDVRVLDEEERREEEVMSFEKAVVSNRASNCETVRNTEVRRRYGGNQIGGRACDNKVKSVRAGVGREVHVLLKGEIVKKVVKWNVRRWNWRVEMEVKVS
jgi:hypothetical protein